MSSFHFLLDFYILQDVSSAIATYYPLVHVENAFILYGVAILLNVMLVFSLRDSLYLSSENHTPASSEEFHPSIHPSNVLPPLIIVQSILFAFRIVISGFQFYLDITTTRVSERLLQVTRGLGGRWTLFQIWETLTILNIALVESFILGYQIHDAPLPYSLKLYSKYQMFANLCLCLFLFVRQARLRGNDVKEPTSPIPAKPLEEREPFLHLHIDTCENYEGSEDCPMCLGPLADVSEKVYVLERCKHAFHHSCISAWAAQGRSVGCPVCRCEMIDGRESNETEA